MQNIELKATSIGQKSFGGKATVSQMPSGVYVLKSYQTEVARINPAGDFGRFWNGYSVTTMKHINAFINEYGNGQTLSKEEWEVLPVLPKP